jgi:hypothetical protein
MSNAKPFVPSDSNIAFANETVQQLDLLVADRKNWESTLYKKSNEALYDVMAKCKKIFEDKFENATSDNDRKAIRLEITHRLTADGIKVQKNSTTLTMFVRYVFGSDRKRAHGYAYVLKAAISHDIRAEGLVKFITEAGGIEEIKRKMVASEKAIANKEKREKAFGLVKTKAELHELSPLASLDMPIVNNRTPYVVLVAKPMTNGKTHVVALLKNASETLVNVLYKHIAKGDLDAQEEQEFLDKEMAGLKAKPAANDTSISEKPMAA